MHRHIFLAGVLAVHAQVAWAQTAVAPDSAMRQAQAELVSASAAILAFYPTEAKAKGVEGTATLSCRRSTDGGYVRCTLVSEAPTGMGFGAAALAIAAAAKGEASVRVPRAYAEAAHPVTFSFRLAPPTIEPNLLLGHVIQPPMWPGELAPPLFPPEAARRGIDGYVILDCLGGLDGRFTDCAIVSETPPGLGFGHAALERAAQMRRDELYPHPYSHGAGASEVPGRALGAMGLVRSAGADACGLAA